MKSVIILIAACCFTAGIADDDNTCGGLNRLKLKNQWNKLYGPGEDRRNFGTVLWKTLVSNDVAYLI